MLSPTRWDEGGTRRSVAVIAEQTEEACDSTRKQVDSCGVVSGSPRGIMCVTSVVLGDLKVRLVAVNLRAATILPVLDSLARHVGINIPKVETRFSLSLPHPDC